jgi:drug/metabolite transporter (DMT)-like permease
MPADEKREENQDWRETRREWRRRHGGAFLIPAGVLIGLGIGLIFNQAGAGVLIGLGLGFLGSALFPAPSRDVPAGPVHPMWGPRWIMVIIGVFLVLLGLSIFEELPLPWTYIFAILLILIGIGFILRGFGRMR